MTVPTVDVTEARRKQVVEGYTYVDCRSIPEFDDGHPADALNIPLLHHDSRTGGMVLNPEFLDVMRANFPADSRLLIGCQAGARSAHAVALLLEAGYRDVFNVAGGYGGTVSMQGRTPGWCDRGLPVDNSTPPGASYDELRRKRQATRS